MDIFGFVNIETEFSLGELATLPSQQLCGGIRFGGRVDDVREEVPALYTECNFL